MGMNYFYRATVRGTQNGKGSENRVPVYAFTDPRGGWLFHWPDLSLDHLKLLIDRVNNGGKFRICIDSYLAHRAFSGKTIDALILNVHDSLDRSSPPTEERKVIATIRGGSMTVNEKAEVQHVPRMTCERFTSERAMQVNGAFTAVTLSVAGGLSFQRW